MTVFNTVLNLFVFHFLHRKPAVPCQSVSARNLVLLPLKTLLSIKKKSKKSTAVKLVKKAKVLASKGKSVSKKQVVQTVKTVNVAAKQPVKSAKDKKEAPKLEKTLSPSNLGQKSKGKEEIPTATKLRLKENNDFSVVKVKKISETKILPGENLPPSSKKMEEVEAKPSESDRQTLKAKISTTNLQEVVAPTQSEITKQTQVNTVSSEIENVKNGQLGTSGAPEPINMEEQKLKVGTAAGGFLTGLPLKRMASENPETSVQIKTLANSESTAQNLKSNEKQTEPPTAGSSAGASIRMERNQTGKDNWTIKNISLYPFHLQINLHFLIFLFLFDIFYPLKILESHPVQPLKPQQKRVKSS